MSPYFKALMVLALTLVVLGFFASKVRAQEFIAEAAVCDTLEAAQQVADAFKKDGIDAAATVSLSLQPTCHFFSGYAMPMAYSDPYENHEGTMVIVAALNLNGDEPVPMYMFGIQLKQRWEL